MIGILILALFLPIILAPFETAGWMARRVEGRVRTPSPLLKTDEPPEFQLVYFTGVAGYSGEFLARREKALLEGLTRAFPSMKIYSDIFPYSVSNLPLDGERVFRWLWTWLHKWRLKVPNNVFDALIVIRNIGQLLVSADPRYGPSFNNGLSEQLKLRLHPEVPTIFLAYSGGAQMAVGAGLGLSGFLKSRPRLIALGGVFTDDPSIREFASVTQIRGRRDRWVPDLGRLIFPGLWRWQFWSTWNRYLSSGCYTEVRESEHSHVGVDDYFGFRVCNEATGLSYQDQTLEILSREIKKTLPS